MQFTTQIPIKKNDNPIGYNSQIVSLGSCFAVNIGQKFDYFKFKNVTNPFGILFNPKALEKVIGFAVNNKTFTEANIFSHNERWHCFDVHSDLSDTNKEVLLNNLNQATATLNTTLKEASHITITLGTAWVYRNNESTELVANCHKVPQKQFSKELLSVEVIKNSLKNILSQINSINTNAQIIFTISPVRHTKDGFTENQWSKANLISAVYEVLANSPVKNNTSYFPSYEIMMDELRDYRFYAEDMIHPNATAINYIWERFTETNIAPEAIGTMKEVDAIQKGLQHRSFNPDSEQHKVFLSKLHERADKLNKQYPHITF
ncbi:hypothetical protein GCM10007424_15770 [Flavobacterium suaedae]|uniref:GSCFA domain-containing protein n=1 Tax=Flavobacterium suaedae TaxID=1767027 RepID=A0ABQ1JSM4_9FLAO|nr:GSCFA domain-containing protein [Flavobacterium suaedae]GGB76605.1 hypothetical protein GCM10007424_15770 [Flavobacterium suaedae]